MKRDALEPNEEGEARVTVVFHEPEVKLLRAAREEVARRSGREPSVSALLRWCVLEADWSRFPRYLG